MYKQLYFTGIVAYVILLFFSVLFFQERTISPDTSFYLYHIIKGQAFRIESFRFGDIFNQLLPLLATKAGLSINAVMTGYSSGYIIYYFICYLVCGSVLKQYDFALTILLLNTLFVTHTFYWIPAQLPQGIALLLLTFAYLRNTELNNTKPAKWVIAGAGLITVAFFHPLVVFVLLYTALFFLERKNGFSSKKLLYIIAAAFVIIVALKPLLFRNPYEQHAMSGLKNFATYFPNYFTLYSDRLFIANCVSKYYCIPLLLTGIILLYGTTRQWKKLLLFCFFFFGYLMLVNVSFPTKQTPVFYMEGLYLPLAIFLALPFVFDLLPVLVKRKLALPVVALILISACARIYTTHTTYTARLDYERTYINRYDGQKVIVKATQQDLDILQMLWSNPYEFLLLSVSDGKNPASILIDERPERLGWAKEKKKELIVNSDIVSYADLPGRYFKFIDTVTGYSIISSH